MSSRESRENGDAVSGFSKERFQCLCPGAAQRGESSVTRELILTPRHYCGG